MLLCSAEQPAWVEPPANVPGMVQQMQPMAAVLQTQRVIVKFKPQATAVQQRRSHAAAPSVGVQRFVTMPGLQVVTLNAAARPEDALAQYRADPSVLYAELDHRVYAYEMPNDPDFQAQ